METATAALGFSPLDGGALSLWASAADRARPVTYIHDYVWVFIIAFLVAFITTPLVRRLALRYAVVDRPDVRRKMHLEPVAYLGGVSIFLGWMAGLLAAGLVLPGHLMAVVGSVQTLLPLNIIAGAVVILVVGLLDDVFAIGPRYKVAGQLFAAAALANQQVPVAGGGEVFLGAKLVQDSLGIVGLAALPQMAAYTLGTAVIALFVLGGCNAVNLIDGLDGLATGMTAICILGLLLVGLHVATIGVAPPQAAYQPVRIVMCIAMLGALLAFLPYNFNPAVIFMGDAGSLLLGYLVMAIILHFSYVGVYGPIFVMAGLIIFAIPIIDTTLAIVRRKMRGVPISSPDCQHLHHQVLRGFRSLGAGTNLSVKLAVIVMYLLGALFAALGTVLALSRGLYVLAVALVLFCFIGVTAFKAGHRQFLLDRLRAAGQLEDDEVQADEPSPAPNPDVATMDEDAPSNRPENPAPSASGRGLG